MRPVGWPMIVLLIASPIMAFAQNTTATTDTPVPPVTQLSQAEPQPVSFDLARVPETDAAVAPGASLSRACASDAVLPGEDPGIVVCVQRERSYASISQDYDKGGWAKPPLPPADPTTLSPGSCVDITCLPPPTVNYFKVIDTLFRIGKKIVEGE